MDHKGLILLLFLRTAFNCLGQTTAVVPDVVTPYSTQSIQFWDGTTWGLRQMVGMSVTNSQLIFSDNSSTNEGRLILAGNNTNGSVTINTNTSGSPAIKAIGTGNVNVTASNDTLRISGVGNRAGYLSVRTNTLTVNDGTLTDVNMVAEVEDGINYPFELYVLYTTGATEQGIKFRMNPNVPERGTFWCTYDFPTNTGRVTGAIYNANTTIVTDTSPSGTNIGVIRGIIKSSAVGAGIFEVHLEVAAEDGSSTVSLLSGSATGY